MPPPITTPITSTKGSSIAVASCDAEVLGRLRGTGDCEAMGPPNSAAEGDEDRVTGESQELLGEQSGGERDDGHGRERKHLRGGNHDAHAIGGFAHPHGRNQPEIVVDRRKNVRDGDNGEDGMARLDERPKNHQLRHEAGRRRNPGERDQENQHQDGSGGIALDQAVQVVHFVANHSLPAQDDHDRERAGVEEGVGKKIESNGLEPALVQRAVLIHAGNKAEQNVADLRDRRIGKHALDVRLRDGGESSDGERENRDGGHDPDPVDTDRPEDREEQAQQQRKAGGFGRDADVGADARGRALIHVRRPLVERHSGDLEKNAGSNGREREERQKIASRPIHIAFGNARGNYLEIRRARDSVQNRKAVGEDARAERAHQEIFHRGFVRAAVAAQESREDVEAERHGFKPYKQDDEIVAAGEEHHAHSGEEHQRVILAVLLLLDFHVTHGEQNDKRRGSKKEKSEKYEERVYHNRVAKRVNGARGLVAPHPKRRAAQDQAQHRGERVPGLLARSEQEIGDQHGQAKKDEHRLRKDERKIAG